MKHNPYTCRLLIRIDRVIYWLTFRKTVWGNSGWLCRVSPSGVKWAVTSHFPDWMYRAATRIQNKWFWTRRILSI